MQPDEGVAVRFNVKYPGYEILMYEIMSGDRTLLPRRVAGENSWNYINRVPKLIKNEKGSS